MENEQEIPVATLQDEIDTLKTRINNLSRCLMTTDYYVREQRETLWYVLFVLVIFVLTIYTLQKRIIENV